MVDGTPAQHAVAGSMGGLVALAMLYPLDMVRVLKQLDDPRVRGKTTWKSLMSLLQTGGSQQLYQGIGANAMTQTVSSFVYFYFLSAIKRTLTLNKPNSVVQDLGAAFIAGILNVIATDPLWVASTRLKVQSNKNKHKNNKEERSAIMALPAMIIHIAATDGVKALWAGTKASLLLVSNPTIQFTTYLQTKLLLSKFRGVETLSSPEYFLLAAWSKFVATLLTYPLQVAQNRLRAHKKDDNKQEKCMGTWECLSDLMNEGGLASLYKGLNSKLLQTLCNAAFMFMFYEKFLQFTVAISL
eukprot:m.66483 g.66483  ORF g.66483 m.66483 type:complete len:299 (+) comp11809_c0_seq1:302-1198(+)